jgi:hypothetical protein
VNKKKQKNFIHWHPVLLGESRWVGFGAAGPNGVPAARLRVATAKPLAFALTPAEGESMGTASGFGSLA